jgi:hypothetical protein
MEKRFVWFDKTDALAFALAFALAYALLATLVLIFA